MLRARTVVVQLYKIDYVILHTLVFFNYTAKPNTVACQLVHNLASAIVVSVAEFASIF